MVARETVALAVLAALAVVALAVDFTGVSLGAVALPATTSLKPCPARNRGTLVAFTLTGAPLRGLRAVRALRSCRSKVPKPTSDNALALLDGDLGVLDQAAEHLVDVGARNQGVLLDRVDEFLAVQRLLLAQ